MKPRSTSDTIRAEVRYDPGLERLALVGLTGPGAGLEFLLSRTASILGRGPGASLVVPDEKASRRHLKLLLLADPVRPTRRVVMLQDLQSTNGVRVDGRQVKSRLLRGGEKILVGETVLRFERRDAFDAAFYGRMQQMATTDPLTGAGNRLALSQEMERQEAERERYKRPYSVLLVDLDHFKTVNDRFGHGVGDETLREVASVILRNLRNSDRIFRYGGEEFVAILPETGCDGAAYVAERVREGVEAASFRAGEKVVRMTVSIGVAEAGTGDVLVRADHALYAAKRRGRNRVRTASTRGARARRDAKNPG